MGGVVLACEGVHPLVCTWGGGGPGMRGLLYCFPQSQASGSWGCQEGQTTDGERASLSKESALQPGGPGRLEKSGLL